MRILFTGDFFYNYSYISEDYNTIINEIKNYDKVFINYEGSFSGLKGRRKNILLTMSDESLAIPKNASLILCNNHTTDFSQSGISNTVEKIKSQNIDYFGLNNNINDDSYYQNYIIKNKEIFIAALGWVNEDCIPANKMEPGVKPFNSRSISELKKIVCDFKHKFKILYIHGGYEWEKYPLPDHVGLSREAIDCGFDMVYFCHSHNIQEYEFYNGKLIHYGLGNFYFSSMRDQYPTIADNGICLICEFDNNDLNYFYREISYNRTLCKSEINEEKKLKKKSLIYDDLEIYSKKYKEFRTRKKNPRPILYYKQYIRNYLKYKFWRFIVDILGFLKIRSVIKSLLGWS